jgi:serine/threonine protein kinase
MTARQPSREPLPAGVNPSGMPSDATQAFLDSALDRVLRAWSDGGDLTVEVLAAERPELRRELEDLLAHARETAIVRPEAVPRIPGYEVLHEIGRGGMGIVYAARQQGLNRLVALKVLPEFVADGERSRRRFLAEAKNLARVRHPHVVTIVDVFEVGAMCSYAMEWIDGKSLADLLHELGARPRNEPSPDVSFGGAGSQRLPPDAVVWFCRMGIAIARALGEVHRCGLIHRDVKPSNILLRADGTPLLSDFGLVRDDTVSLTRSGQIVGTLAFSPPEQLSGANDRIGPQSDLFAFGATLHWAVAGTAPFAGQTAVELCANIESRARQPLTKLGLSRDLETIVGKCLEPRLEDRYASADAVADDLENLLALRPIAARPLGVLPRTWRLLRRNRGAVLAAALSAIVVLVVGVVLVWQFWNRVSAPEQFEKHLRAAHRALLEESHDERVARAERGETMPVDPVRKRIQKALVSYEAASTWMPAQRDVVHEIEVVTLADKVLRSLPATNSRAAHAKVDLIHPLPEPLAGDARRRGLYAFLLGDTRTCHEAWADLDLAPSKPDPLVDAATGQLHLAGGDAGKAYPRLLRAFHAWPDVGFLAVAVADCAVRLGDLGKAEQYLAVADDLGYPGQSRTWVRGQLRAAQGRIKEARAEFESVNWHPEIATQEHARLCFVELLQHESESETDRERALVLLLQLAEYGSNRTQDSWRLGEVAESWWAALPMPRREIELLRCWNTSEGWPLLRRLAAVGRQLDGESPGNSTRTQSGASPAVHRQARSMSLEFTVMTSSECQLLRAVPALVQRIAALSLLLTHDLVGQRVARAAPAPSLAMRFGTLPAVLALGWILVFLTPEATGQVQWVNRTSTPAVPSARHDVRGAFDSLRGQVLLHGGFITTTGPTSELWAWNGSSGAWTSVPQPTNPGNRFHSGLVREGANSLIQFGGASSLGGPSLGDTWRWDGAVWTQLSPSVSPSARESHAMCYDSHRGVVVLFGGNHQAADTWEWSSVSGNWVRCSPMVAPPVLHDAALSYDQDRQRSVLFGGNHGAINGFTGSNETYEWDGANWARRATVLAPIPRFGHGMCWDIARRCTVVFGGWTDSSYSHRYLNDIWEWDGSTWTEIAPVPGPAPSGRFGHLFVYDPVRRGIVSFGGKTGHGTTDVSAETWILEPVVHADVTNTGPGCAGVLGTPSLTAALGSLPWLGETLMTHITGIPNFFPVPFLVAGFGNPSAAGLFCRPGCTLRTTLDVAYSLSPTGNQASWSLAIPNHPGLLGVRLFAQAATFDFATLCTDSLSNGIEITIGGR